MRVRHDEGLAIRIGREPCAVPRGGAGEASAGDGAGQPLSRVSDFIPGADSVSYLEGNMDGHAIASGHGHQINALAGLLATATAALDTDGRAARSYIQRAAALLGIDLTLGGDGAAEHSGLQGGLASWQAKRIRSYIEDKLDSNIRATDLAGVVRLSMGYFSRAFRQTFGESPFAYIMRRRVRRAQQLMLTSRRPLSQVALECGMCDQSHLCRVFRRVVGINPNAWRRRFSVGPAPEGSVGRKIPIRTSR